MKKLILMLLIVIFPPLQAGQLLDKVVAVVNDNVITESELNTQVVLIKKQLESNHAQIPSNTILRKQVLQHLIDLNLQLQLAKQNDITVDSTELNDAIVNIAHNNHLSMDALRTEINRQGLTWPEYRENIRKEILISRLQQKAINSDLNISTTQVDNYLKIMQQDEKKRLSYHLQNIVIPLSEEPSPDELTKAYNKAKDILTKLKQGAAFTSIASTESTNNFILGSDDLGLRHLAELPEVFARRVVTMQVNSVAGPIRTGNGLQLIKLIAIGDEEQHEVVKTHVRHILIKSGASITAKEAKQQADNVYHQLKSGANFARMAKKYSADTSSAAKGGDLGWVSPQELVPEFAKTMDALPLHKISQPIQTGFGWHLIEVLERKKINDSAAFKREQVKKFLQQRKFNEAVQNWQQHIRSTAYIKITDQALA